MKITYIGTAAAEGLPALFCQCPICESARKNGGKEIRGRAAICVNDTLLIDFPPDIYYGAMRAGVDLSKILDIVGTHDHGDHFSPTELSWRVQPVYCTRVENDQLHFYGNRSHGERINDLLPGAKDGHGEDGGLTFDYAESFKPIETAAGIIVTPLPADHDWQQECRMMLLEEKSTGKTFLYAHDTGMFPEETMEFLRGKRCDLISLDCTYAVLGDEEEWGHMGIKANETMKNRLIANGTADEKTGWICHHFSHNGFISDERVYLQEEFEAIAAGYGFTMSYDGMKVEI